jgi:hypothetical protein
MKTKIFCGWRWVLAVSSTVALFGCLDQTSQTGAQTVVEPSAAEVATTSASDPLPSHAIIPPANLSPGLAEVVKLAQSGVGESVLLAYVEKSNHAFNPSVDEIVYLKDLGVSDAIVAAMVRHGNAMNESAQTPSSAEMAENKTAVEPAPTNLLSTNLNSTGPSLIDPNAPSYSVAAETNYDESATAAQPQQVNINYFESTLSPYGSWVDVADYGRCWQPTVVAINRSWRPYGDRGRWLYTSNGWYWQSDYSWGWAAFHYGRWHCDNRIGWVWVPGSTWGPAWVSWRYTDQYCGWAPLPPGARYYGGSGFYYQNSRVGISFDFGLRADFYTFIPTSRFCERTPSRFYVHGSHSQTIYKNSVVINKYTRGTNNTIINEGVGRERITRATHTPIRTVALRELPTTASPVGRAERLEGNSLTVFRPNVSTSASSRSIPQRSVTTTASVTQKNSQTPNRSLRSIPKSETVSTPNQSTSALVAPVDPFPKTTPRTFPSSGVTRNSSRSISAPNETATSKNFPQRSVETAQPGASGLRSLPGRSAPQEIHRNIQRRELTIAPKETPSISPPKSVVRETPIAPVVRATPTVPQQRLQPTVRETRRVETPEFSASRSLRSIAPAPSLSAPAQNFNSQREISRGSSRIERSAPQVSQPRSAPTPSFRQSAPRQESAPRQQIERSVERSGRSDRGRS